MVELRNSLTQLNHRQKLTCSENSEMEFLTFEWKIDDFSVFSLLIILPCQGIRFVEVEVTQNPVLWVLEECGV